MLSNGFPAVNFVVINTMATANQSMSLALLRSKAADIPVYQETPSEPVWDLLGGKNASILVFDRCGRMVYQLIEPWSSPDYQYVKAAILSAYRDDVCGSCTRTRARGYRTSDVSSTDPTDETSTPKSTESTTDSSDSEQRDQSTTPVSQNLRDHQAPDIFEPSSEEIQQPNTNSTPKAQDSVDSHVENFSWDRHFLLHINNVGDAETDCEPNSITSYDPLDETVTLSPLVEINGKIPIRVIYREEHTHTNNPGQIEDYVILQTSNPQYHGHLRPNNDIPKTEDNSGIVENNLERGLNLTTSRELSASVELMETSTTTTSTPKPYFDIEQRVTAVDIVDSDDEFSVISEFPARTRQKRKRKRRKNKKRFRQNLESAEFKLPETTPGIEELVEERQRDFDSEQNMFDVIEHDDVVKIKIIESYRRLLPWLDYDL